MHPEFFPVSGNKPKQIMIMLHGVGANGENLMPLATHFADILPDCYFTAPNGIEKYDMTAYFDFGPSFQWFSLTDRSYVAMKAGIENAAKFVSNLIADLSKKFAVPYSNIILSGFSQGAMLALHTGLTIDQKLGGVLCYSGAFIVSNESELNLKSKPSICLVHGMIDDVVPYDRSVIANEKLKELGVESQLHGIKGLSHSIDYTGIEVSKKFISDLGLKKI